MSIAATTRRAVRTLASSTAGCALAAAAWCACATSGVGTDVPSGDADAGMPTFDADSGKHDASGPSPDAATTCKPKTCSELGFDCGAASDGCNSVIDCGTCASGQTCGAGGNQNKCGQGTCPHKTCQQLNANCGPIGDGCGNTLQCGSCAAPQTCGGGGAPNQCGCTATTCGAQGATCGSISDGCGGTLPCGSCSSGQTCSNGKCVCQPTTCGAQNAACGSISDGCGGTLTCGSCNAGETCVSNKCQAAADSGGGCTETDDFTSTLVGWTYFGPGKYTLTVDTNDSAAYVSGDDYNTQSEANGMEKTFSITPGTLKLSFGWRAASTYSGSTVTNAYLLVQDGSSQSQLYAETLVAGGTQDTGWQSYSKDLSSYVGGSSSVTIRLYLVDAWSTNWNEQNWYKTIAVTHC